MRSTKPVKRQPRQPEKAQAKEANVRDEYHALRSDIQQLRSEMQQLRSDMSALAWRLFAAIGDGHSRGDRCHHDRDRRLGLTEPYTPTCAHHASATLQLPILG